MYVGVSMARESQLREYERKAKAADLEEERAKDLQAKQSWERIAVGYWELADMVRRRDQEAY